MSKNRSTLSLSLPIATVALLLGACSSNNNSSPTTNVVATGTVTATFQNSNGKPVVGAAVAISPDVSAIVAACPVTAADGTWSCKLPAGWYSFTVSGTGVTKTTFTNVAEVITGQTTNLTAPLVVPYSPIVLTLSTTQNALAAGFNAPVTIQAKVSGATSSSLTFTWGTSSKAGRAAPAAWGKGKAYTQYVWVVNGGNVYECETSGTSATSGSGPTGTTSPIADGTVSWNYLGALPAAPAITVSPDGTAGTFTTESFAFLTNPANFIVRNQDLPNRPGLVGITVGDGEYMAYSVPVKVSDGTYTQNASLTIYPASFSHGTTNNPIGAMVVLTDGDVASGPSPGSGAPFAET